MLGGRPSLAGYHHRRLYVTWGRIPGQNHPRHLNNRKRSLTGSREGHDQAERAITGPSRRFLVLFAESKSTSPAQTLRWFAPGAPTISYSLGRMNRPARCGGTGCRPTFGGSPSPAGVVPRPRRGGSYRPPAGSLVPRRTCFAVRQTRFVILPHCTALCNPNHIFPCL